MNTSLLDYFKLALTDEQLKEYVSEKYFVTLDFDVDEFIQFITKINEHKLSDTDYLKILN